MAKYKQTFTSEILDKETGELVTLETQKVFTEKINPEHFYMTFIDYVAPIYQLHSEVARKMLDWMCENAGFNTGIVDLSTSKRNQMCKDLEITTNQVTNNLKKLKDLKLISGDKGTFTVNPEIFWKGDAKSRRDILAGKEFEVTFKIK